MKVNDNLLKDLMLDFSKGNTPAFHLFYEHTKGLLFGYLYSRFKDRTLCADILQETYISLWRYRQTMKPVEAPVRYLYKVCNRIIFRTLERQMLFNDIDHCSEFALHPAYEMNHDFWHLKKKWMDVVNNLPPQQRGVYKLVVMEELSHKDAGRALNLSISTISNYLTIANKKVRQQLSEFCP